MPGDAGWHNAQLDFSKSMSYGDYLSLNSILDAQHPLSPDHNEMLFIIQHQTSELWMKLALFELRGALDAVRTDALPPAFKMLARVSRILEQLVQAWNVLSTMTPSEYSAMRPYLGSRRVSSRTSIGSSNSCSATRTCRCCSRMRTGPTSSNRCVRRSKRRRSTTKSCACSRGAASRSRPSGSSATGRSRPGTTRRSKPRGSRCTVIRSSTGFYEMAEELVDLEDAFRQWRFRHVTTVERIIGFKQGTGGTSGAPYLRKMLDVVLFPELARAHHAVTHDAPGPAAVMTTCGPAPFARLHGARHRGMCRRTTSSATQTMPIAIASIVR